MNRQAARATSRGATSRESVHRRASGLPRLPTIQPFVSRPAVLVEIGVTTQELACSSCEIAMPGAGGSLMRLQACQAENSFRYSGGTPSSAESSMSCAVQRTRSHRSWIRCIASCAPKHNRLANRSRRTMMSSGAAQRCCGSGSPAADRRAARSHQRIAGSMIFVFEKRGKTKLSPCPRGRLAA